MDADGCSGVCLDSSVVGLELSGLLQILGSLGGIVVKNAKTLVSEGNEVVGVNGEFVVEYLLGSGLVASHRVHVVELLHHTVGLVLSVDVLQLVDVVE